MAARTAPPNATDLKDLNARLATVEKTVGENLLELKHGQQAQRSAIDSIQNDMHRLVKISEVQVELQQKWRESSSAIDRAFTEMQKNRDELTAAVREASRTFAKWRDEHERENRETASTVRSHQTGARLVWAGVTLLAGLAAAWVHVQFLRVDEAIASGDARTRQLLEGHMQAATAAERRIETRLERLEYGERR